MKLLIITENINMFKYVFNKHLLQMQRIKMKSYCLKCRKDTENINPKIWKTSNGRTMLLSKCAICGNYF